MVEFRAIRHNRQTDGGDNNIPFAFLKKRGDKNKVNRVLTNSELGLFYSNFLILTLTFSKVPIEKYGKTPNFSGKHHFYSYFQNPSENSGLIYVLQYVEMYNTPVSPGSISSVAKTFKKTHLES